jgi:GWxTD domain-containing protein
MTLLESWVQSSAAEAIGWTVVHSLWQGAGVSVVLALVLAATRSPQVRYRAACAAMLMMLAGFGITLSVGVPNDADDLGAMPARTFRTWDVPGGTDSPGGLNLGIAGVVPWLAPFWVAGVWVFYLRHFAGLISVSRMRRCGVCCAPERWQNELVRLRARVRVSRPVLLLESSLAEVPMVLGYLRPIILVPAGLLAGLPSGQVEAILLHELAHIRRCDYLVNLCQRLAEGLLFYHPVVWWISRVIRTEREHCCDDLAVGISGNAHEYATALAALEQSRWAGREPAMAATGGSLVKRIRRLLYPEGSNGGWMPLFGTVVFLFVVGAAALTAWPLTQAQQNPAPAQTGTPFQKWLNEDVVYIIADEERSAFEKLTSDEEREKFIEQFWARRDPTMGTARNEFKEEHYRRIAYANDRFGTIGRSGWQTDRGRIYIVYGPPDQVEAHMQGPQKPNPSQIWTYRHVDGVGDFVSITFIDRTGRGDYRLAPGNAR